MAQRYSLLEAKRVLRKTEKAALVQLTDGRRGWFPFSQCPGLQLYFVGEGGEFGCAAWLLRKREEEGSQAASGGGLQLQGDLLRWTNKAALVLMAGGEQIWFPFSQCPELQLDILADEPPSRVQFICPGWLVKKNGLERYGFTLPEIAERLRVGQLSVGHALELEKIPEPVGQHFACDCAEWLLEQFQESGEEGNLSMEDEHPLCQSWPEIKEALRLKRLWLDEAATTEQVEEACAKMLDLFTERRLALEAAERSAKRSANVSVQGVRSGGGKREGGGRPFH